MKRLLGIVCVGLSSILIGFAGMGLSPAQAATVTDTFALKLTIKQWCQGNPNRFENMTVKIDPKNPSVNTTLMIRRDDSDPTNIVEATINTQGGNADIDAITLRGKGVPRNKAKRKGEFVLSGVHPDNSDHYVTFRRVATVDKLGNLTNLRGTLIAQYMDTYTTDKQTKLQSPAVECLASGNFVTGKRLSSATGGGVDVGSLTVADAPATVAGTFVPDGSLNQQIRTGDTGVIAWAESGILNHVEVVIVSFDFISGHISAMTFLLADSGGEVQWNCSGVSDCAAGSLDLINGVMTFNNMVLHGPLNPNPQVTLNGTLEFAPF